MDVNYRYWGLQVAQWLKKKVWLTMQETSLGPEDPLEEETATHSSVLAWDNPTDRGAWQTTVHGVSKSWTKHAHVHYKY